MGKLEELVALVEEDETFPEQACEVFAGMLEQCRATAERIEALEAEIVAHARRDVAARRLATIPGVGPITASLIDRKSTRLKSSHANISYAVFCLKKQIIVTLLFP